MGFDYIINCKILSEYKPYFWNGNFKRDVKIEPVNNLGLENMLGWNFQMESSISNTYSFLRILLH